jgi:diguanylate cyclase (GGDEF)-like protein
MMASLPDLATLRLCSMMSSLAFATMFCAFWATNRRQPYFLHWAASAALYAIVLEAFALADGHSLLIAAVFGLLAASDVLIMTGVQLFDGRRRARPYEICVMTVALIIPMLSVFRPMTNLFPAELAADLPMFGLATSKLAVGCWTLFTREKEAPLGRRFAGIAMLGYVPTYVIASIAGHYGMGALHLAAILPMLADQLLLAALNIALMAMPAERATAKMREKVLRDPLTGVRNRAWLESYRKDRAEVDAAVILVDIDHFKRINDRFGHAAGDQVLTNFAARANEVLTAQHGVLARLGGDEFIAIVPDADIERAAKIAEDLLDSMKIWTWGVPRATASLGVAVPGAGDNLSRVMARADRNLYRAKAAGRDRVAVN